MTPEEERDRGRIILASLVVAVASLAVAAFVAHPVELLEGLVIVAPFTGTVATWYLRHVYLSDRRVGSDGLPLRSAFLRRAWRSAALVTGAAYPIAFIVSYSLLRQARPDLDLGGLPPGVGATVIGVGLLAGLIVPHWLAIAVWLDRRRPPGSAEPGEEERPRAGHQARLDRLEATVDDTHEKVVEIHDEIGR